MAGFTGFAIGHVSNKTCFIPLEEMVSGDYSNRISLANIEWQRLLAGTGQPSFLNDLG
jgi:6-phosphofructokinase 1